MERIEQGWSPLCHSQQAEDDEWGVLKVGCVNGTSFDHNENKALPADLEPRAHYEIRSGDILMSRANTKSLLGSAAIVKQTRPRLLLCDKLYRLVVSKRIDPDYAVLVMRTDIARFQYERAATGTSGSMQNIGQETIKDLLIPLPPLPEQRAIVAMLDRETARIDALIEKKRRLLELLEEKRLAVITHAVTKGLDASAPMKDSGIDWLGQIPAHWEVMPFNRHCSIVGGQVDPEVEPYSSMPLVAPDHIESGSGMLGSITTAAEQGAISGKYLFRSGDIIYSKIRPELRKMCVAQFDGLCSADMYAIRHSVRYKTSFLFYLLLSKYHHQFATLESLRVAMPKVNRETLSTFRCVVPPISEQQLIGEHIKKELIKISAFQHLQTRAVQLLQERRSALITNAVTGKIDVRAAVHKEAAE